MPIDFPLKGRRDDPRQWRAERRRNITHLHHDGIRLALNGADNWDPAAVSGSPRWGETVWTNSRGKPTKPRAGRGASGRGDCRGGAHQTRLGCDLRYWPRVARAWTRTSSPSWSATMSNRSRVCSRLSWQASATLRRRHGTATRRRCWNAFLSAPKSLGESGVIALVGNAYLVWQVVLLAAKDDPEPRPQELLNAHQFIARMLEPELASVRVESQ